MKQLITGPHLFSVCFICLFGALTARAQQQPFSKTVNVYTKSPSLNCPHLVLKLKDNIAKRPSKISNAIFDSNTHQKITFSVRDSSFFSTDSIISLFKSSGFPAIELTRLEMEGKAPLDLK